jgi:hypothetical protein
MGVFKLPKVSPIFSTATILESPLVSLGRGWRVRVIQTKANEGRIREGSADYCGDAGLFVGGGKCFLSFHVFDSGLITACVSFLGPRCIGSNGL